MPPTPEWPVERSVWFSVRPLEIEHPKLEDLVAVQTFEGVVLDAGPEELRVRLHDVTDPSRPDEIATMDIEEVPEDDRALIEVGAVFDWLFFRQRRPSVRNVSELRFRRLPRWSQPDLDRARNRADEFRELFDLAADGTSAAP